MTKYINKRMKWWRQSLRRFVSCWNRPHPNPPLGKGSKPESTSPNASGGLRGVKQRLLLSLLIVAIVSGCNSTAIESSKRLTSKQPSIPCRVVQHAMGETCVPHNPQRLVTIPRFTLANALVLGIKPIGSTSDYQDSLYLRNKIEGIEQIGEVYEPNLEKILLLKPDLILVWEPARTIYPLLSQISPTVVVPWQLRRSFWREDFNLVAEALGKQEVAQQAWNRYYQRIEELKVALNNRYKDKEISVISVYGGIRIYKHNKDSFAGSILSDVGLQRPKAQNIKRPDYFEPVTEEKLEEIDGDIIFVLIFREKEEKNRKAFEKLQQKALWKTLRAVQQNQVYSVDSETWLASNLIAADGVIDDLYKYLVNTP